MPPLFRTPGVCYRSRTMDVDAVGDFLRTVRPLAGFADADLSELAAPMRERRLRAGQVLAYEGKPGTEMYFVQAGWLAIVKGGHVPMTLLSSRIERYIKAGGKV